MKHLARYFQIPLLCIGSTLLLGGCATMEHNPISNSLTVEAVSIPGSQLWRATATDDADGKGITVSGELLPRWYLAAIPDGHVDVDIIAPNKQILQHSCAPYRMKHLSHKQRRYYFRVSIPMVPS